MRCLICNKKDYVEYLDNYKLEIDKDISFFKDQKIYQCKECKFSFVYPMPSSETLNNFYEKVGFISNDLFNFILHKTDT